MAFRYSLLSLLRLRQALERQEEQKLVVLARTVMRMRRAVEDLDEGQLQAQRAALTQLSQGSVAAELQFANVCATAYERVRNQLVRELKAAETRRLEQMKTYCDARQKREILDGLRERQEAAHTLESARREQQNADEVFLLRLFRATSDQVLPSRRAESAQDNEP